MFQLLDIYRYRCVLTKSKELFLFYFILERPENQYRRGKVTLMSIVLHFVETSFLVLGVFNIKTPTFHVSLMMLHMNIDFRRQENLHISIYI